MTNRLLALAACGLAIPAVRAADPPGPTAADVPALVAKLGASDFRTRDAATRQLRAVGPAALPALKDATASRVPEVAQRAHRLVNEITLDDDSARFTRYTSTVRIKHTGAPLTAVVADLAAKTGLALELETPDPAVRARLVTLDTGDLPAWEAVAKVCAACGLGEKSPTVPKPPVRTPGDALFDGQFAAVQPVPPPDPRILLVDGAIRPPTAVRGGVRIAVRSDDSPHGKGVLALHLDVTAVSSVNWKHAVEVSVLRAETTDGRKLPMHFREDEQPQLEPDTDDGAILLKQMLVGNSIHYRIAAPKYPRLVPLLLAFDGERPERLKVVEGVVVGEVAVPETRAVSIPNVVKAIGKPVDVPDVAAFTIRQARASGVADGESVVEVLVGRTRSHDPSLAAGAFKMGYGSIKAMTFFDAAGKPLKPTGTEGESHDDGFLFTLSFAGPPPASATVSAAITRLARVRVPFKLADVAVR